MEERLNLHRSEKISLLKNIEQLENFFEKKISWLSVIHADGNGLGQIFQNFRQESKATSDRDYIEKYRKFSLALDECTINATVSALEKLIEINDFCKRVINEKTKNEEIFIPFIPLILGGDDLTVICDGEYAIGPTNSIRGSRVNTVFDCMGSLSQRFY